MAKSLEYSVFLDRVLEEQKDFANEINQFLLENGCEIKVDPEKNGSLVSYKNLKTKKVVVNFVFYRYDLAIRIYADNVGKYIDEMQNLSEEMIDLITKAGDCKRLTDFGACNLKCNMGYEFTIKDKIYKKCRYGCFKFKINDVTFQHIMDFIKNELKYRNI